MTTPYQRNVKEQYEELGRFVEAFELLVRQVRVTCLALTATDEDHPLQEKLLQVAFHHQALTAKPLFEIMRAMIAEIVNLPTHRSYSDREFYRDLLGHVQKQYDHLANTRNNLLHGTWFIGGISFANPESETFYLQKYTASKRGLTELPLPRTAKELRELSERCGDLLAWLENIELSLDRVRTVKIKDLFNHQDGVWKLTDDRARHTSIRSFRP
jgi:hypothetical protein